MAYDERTLWLAYRLRVETGDRLHLRFEQHVRKPRQGMLISVANRRHAISINGQTGRTFALWADTAPRSVTVEVSNAGRGSEVVLHNVWELDKYGTMLHGLNWAAMDVRPQADGSVLLECSDGFGVEPSFNDLVVRLKHEHRP